MPIAVIVSEDLAGETGALPPAHQLQPLPPALLFLLDEVPEWRCFDGWLRRHDQRDPASADHDEPTSNPPPPRSAPSGGPPNKRAVSGHLMNPQNVRPKSAGRRAACCAPRPHDRGSHISAKELAHWSLIPAPALRIGAAREHGEGRSRPRNPTCVDHLPSRDWRWHRQFEDPVRSRCRRDPVCR